MKDTYPLFKVLKFLKKFRTIFIVISTNSGIMNTFAEDITSNILLMLVLLIALVILIYR